jgi:hypothetical protein
MEQRWNEIDKGKTEVFEENPVPVPLCPPLIPHGLTRASAATNRLSHGTAPVVLFNSPVKYLEIDASLLIKHRRNALRFTTLLYFNRPIHTRMFRFMQKPSSRGSKLHIFTSNGISVLIVVQYLSV